MKTITIEITDDEWAVWQAAMPDPEAWIRSRAAAMLASCIDKVYEASTGKVARQREQSAKTAELAKDYTLIPRADNTGGNPYKQAKK